MKGHNVFLGTCLYPTSLSISYFLLDKNQSVECHEAADSVYGRSEGYRKSAVHLEWGQIDSFESVTILS